MSHNIELTGIQRLLFCPNCGKKCRTIFQPNDEDTRTADFRSICEKCNKTYLIKENDFKKYCNKEYENMSG